MAILCRLQSCGLNLVFVRLSSEHDLLEIQDCVKVFFCLILFSVVFCFCVSLLLGFKTAYSQLYFATKKEFDPCSEITDVNLFIAKSLGALICANPNVCDTVYIDLPLCI